MTATIKRAKAKAFVAPEISVCICPTHGKRPDGELRCKALTDDVEHGVALRCSELCEVVKYTPALMPDFTRWVGRPKDEVIDLLERRLGGTHRQASTGKPKALDCQGKELGVGDHVADSEGYYGYIKDLGMVGDRVIAELDWPGLDNHEAARPDKFMNVAELELLTKADKLGL